MDQESEADFAKEPRPKELRRCPISGLLLALTKIEPFESMCMSTSIALEGGMQYSLTARLIMRKRYGVTIGAFSYGGCFERGAIPPGGVVGRYVSVAGNLKVFRRTRFLEWLSLHPFFYNPCFGFVDKDPLISPPFTIESDAWIGERVIVTPGCCRIGLGAVVGAGSVVTKNVPDFAIVVGNPARILRFRFPEETRELIRQTRWWQLPLSELTKRLPNFTRAIGDTRWLRELERLSDSPGE